MRLKQETEQITVEGLRMLVETNAATCGLLIAAGELEALVWFVQNLQEISVASLKEIGVDLDKTLNVKMSDN